MEKAPFSGISVMAPGEPLSGDGYAFTGLDRRIIDRLLRLGALAHRHDGRPALAMDGAAPTVSMEANGGQIPAGTTVFVGYTYVDADGGETVLNEDQVQVSSPGALEDPTLPPTGVLDHDAGLLLAGNYYYSVSVIDGQGGETIPSPQVAVTIPPGYPTSRITVGGLQAIVTEVGGTGWRLWRSIDSGRLTMMAQGATDTVLDDGSLCPDCSAQPPTTTNTTRRTALLRVQVPQELPNLATAVRIYASQDGSFENPCLLEQVPKATSDEVRDYPQLDLVEGAPPTVSTALPGANKIDPDAELIDWHWKRPVATSAELPTAVQGSADGDVRVTLDDRHFNVFTTANGWEEILFATDGGAAASSWMGVFPTVADLPAVADDGSFALTEDDDRLWVRDQSAWRAPAAGSGGGDGGGAPSDALTYQGIYDTDTSATLFPEGSIVKEAGLLFMAVGDGPPTPHIKPYDFTNFGGAVAFRGMGEPYGKLRPNVEFPASVGYDVDSIPLPGNIQMEEADNRIAFIGVIDVLASGDVEFSVTPRGASGDLGLKLHLFGPHWETYPAKVLVADVPLPHTLVLQPGRYWAAYVQPTALVEGEFNMKVRDPIGSTADLRYVDAWVGENGGHWERFADSSANSDSRWMSTENGEEAALYLENASGYNKLSMSVRSPDGQVTYQTMLDSRHNLTAGDASVAGVEVPLENGWLGVVYMVREVGDIVRTEGYVTKDPAAAAPVVGEAIFSLDQIVGWQPIKVHEFVTASKWTPTASGISVREPGFIKVDGQSANTREIQWMGGATGNPADGQVLISLDGIRFGVS